MMIPDHYPDIFSIFFGIIENKDDFHHIHFYDVKGDYFGGVCWGWEDGDSFGGCDHNFGSWGVGMGFGDVHDGWVEDDEVSGGYLYENNWF